MDRTDFIIHNADTYAVPILEKTLSRLSNSTNGSRYILPRIWSQAGFSMREAIEKIEKESEPELRRFYIHLLAEPSRLGMRQVQSNLDSSIIRFVPMIAIKQSDDCSQTIRCFPRAIGSKNDIVAYDVAFTFVAEI